MKVLLIALGVIAAGTTAVAEVAADEPFEAKTIERAKEAMFAGETESQHQIAVGDATYGGITVAAVKADYKLQLLNPVAADEYGTVEDSVVRDHITGAATGLKIFSIEF